MTTSVDQPQLPIDNYQGSANCHAQSADHCQSTANPIFARQHTHPLFCNLCLPANRIVTARICPPTAFPMPSNHFIRPFTSHTPIRSQAPKGRRGVGTN